MAAKATFPSKLVRSIAGGRSVDLIGGVWPVATDEFAERAYLAAANPLRKACGRSLEGWRKMCGRSAGVCGRPAKGLRKLFMEFAKGLWKVCGTSVECLWTV